MKKSKILAAVVAAAVLSVSGGVLAGCNDGHTHTYSGDWAKDETGHWHVATCDDLKKGDKDYTKDFAAHVWGNDDECDICHYQRTPVITEVTIKLDANGGVLAGDKETEDVATKGGKIETLPTPTAPEGMEFVGWFTEDVAGTEVTTDTSFTQNGTIYAHYVSVYTITLNANGGTLDVTEVKAKGGKISELPTPTAPADKQFAGWYTTAEDGEVTGELVTTDTVFEEDATIYARYASVYTVTLDVGEGGTLPTDTATTLTTQGGKLVSLPTPETQNSMVFLGWYTTAEDTATATGVLVTTDYLFTGEETAITLYARYRQEASVTLNVGVGTLPDGTETTLITSEGKIAELPTPAAPENHWFKGWYTAETDGLKVLPTTDLISRADPDTHTITLYARFVQEVTVTLNAGEDGTLPDGAITTYTTLNGKIQFPEGVRGLPAVTVSKEHWSFFGWVNGTSAVNADTTVFEADTELTAKIGRESGIWSADGQTFIKSLTVNDGCTDHLQYWLGDGGNFTLEKDTEIAIYLDGTLIPHKIKSNSTCVNYTSASKVVNTVTVTETAKFVVYFNKWSDGWQCEYTGTPANKVTNEIPEGAAAVTITATNGSCTVYFVDKDGNAITADNLGKYQIHAWTGSSTNEFGAWGSNPYLNAPLNKKGNLTTDTTFIIHWTGGQSGNFSNMEVGKTYVVELKTSGGSVVYDYVPATTPETPEVTE